MKESQLENSLHTLHKLLTPMGTHMMLQKLVIFSRLEIVLECGRYASFSSIPSVSWRVTSVLIGVASSLALLVAFIAVIGCFTADAVNHLLAKTLGFIQFVAGEFAKRLTITTVCECCGIGSAPLASGSQRFHPDNQSAGS